MNETQFNSTRCGAIMENTLAVTVKRIEAAKARGETPSFLDTHPLELRALSTAAFLSTLFDEAPQFQTDPNLYAVLSKFLETTCPELHIGGEKIVIACLTAYHADKQDILDGKYP